MDVFLSYANTDRKIAQLLVRELRQKGISVWADAENISPGENIFEAIYSAIQQASNFVVLISANAKNSNFLASEIATALAVASNTSHEFRIIPVIVEKGAELPPFLRQIQALDLTDPNNYEKAFEQLADVLKSRQVTKSVPSPEAVAQYESLLPETSSKIFEMAISDKERQYLVDRTLAARKNLGFAFILSLVGMIAVLGFIFWGDAGKFSVIVSFLGGLMSAIVGYFFGTTTSKNSSKRSDGGEGP